MVEKLGVAAAKIGAMRRPPENGEAASEGTGDWGLWGRQEPKRLGCAVRIWESRGVCVCVCVCVLHRGRQVGDIHTKGPKGTFSKPSLFLSFPETQAQNLVLEIEDLLGFLLMFILFMI